MASSELPQILGANSSREFQLFLCERGPQERHACSPHLLSCTVLSRKTCVEFAPALVNIASVAEKSEMTIPESSEVRCCSQFRNPHKCAVVLVSGIGRRRIPESSEVRCCSQFRNCQNGEFLNFVGSRRRRESPSTVAGAEGEIRLVDVSGDLRMHCRSCVAARSIVRRDYSVPFQIPRRSADLRAGSRWDVPAGSYG